ncbi:hypothetical protein FTO70_01900 [Methanosarcina sp. KYL-1]|uniref:hypothetical protein n=1 Tax=Methanosarcina sp. KYL-1 TaxID=2602068 RepID=UPI002100B867|nr:hypothetical protein [Methanosarcina sp. KYL-1]MCQ1534470.1 hypothetical protein [Methanosarcina sp. KYL-1]
MFAEGNIECVEKLLKPAKRVLKVGMPVKHDAFERRVELWNKIRMNYDSYLDEECGTFLKDLDQHFLSLFDGALLVLAASFRENGEFFGASKIFSDAEVELLRNIERYNLFEILSADDIRKKLIQKDDGVLALLRDYYISMDSWVDGQLEDPALRLTLRYYLKKKWDGYKEKLNSAVSSSVVELDWLKSLIGSWEHATEARVGVAEKGFEAEKERAKAEIEKLSSEKALLSSEKELTEGRLKQAEAEKASAEAQAKGIASEKEQAEEKLRQLAARKAETEALLQAVAEEKLQAQEQAKAMASEKTLAEEQIREIAFRKEEVEEQLKALEAEKARAEEQVKAIESEKALAEEQNRAIAAEKEAAEEQARKLAAEKEQVEEKVRRLAAEKALAEGKGSRYVKLDEVKQYELNFVGRLEHRLGNTVTFSGRAYKVENLREIKQVDTSCFAESSGLSARDLKSLPENRSLVGALTEKKLLGKKQRYNLKALFSARVEKYAEAGFDTDPLELKDLNVFLVDSRDEAKEKGEWVLLCLASPTGFEAAVGRYISSEDFHRNFLSKYLSVCLLDLETGKQLYNPHDEVAREFAKLCELETETEKSEKLILSIRKAIEDGLLLKDFVVLGDIAKSFGNESVVKPVFYEYAGENGHNVRFLEDIGLVMMK